MGNVAEILKSTDNSLNQLLTKFEVTLLLDAVDLSLTRDDETEWFLKEVNSSSARDTFSGIYDVELACRKLEIPSSFPYKNILATSLEDELFHSGDIGNQPNASEIMIKYEKILRTIKSNATKIVIYLSSIIDLVNYHQLTLFDAERYNYYGFDRDTYEKFLDLFLVESKAVTVLPATMYKVFTGGKIIYPDYVPTRKAKGVANYCSRETYEYRIHRLMCLLMRLDMLSPMAVVARLLRVQMEVNKGKIMG